MFEISSQAYSFASFIPGQLGIDAWRIAKLRTLDLTKFKTNLIKSTILEKSFALLSQIFILKMSKMQNLHTKMDLNAIF